MRVVALGLMLAVVGCGDNDAVPDAPADASSDAPDVPVMITTSNGSPGTAPVFPPVLPGQVSTMTLTATNTSAAPSGAITLSLQGTNASAFAIDLQASTCDGATLQPQETCTIVLTFQAATVGAYAAEVVLSADFGTTTVDVVAHAGMPSVTLTPSAHPFGLVEIGVGSTQAFTLTNTGNGSSTLGAPTVSGAGFNLSSTTCGSTLAAGASCSLVVAAAPTDFISITGNLDAIADGVTHTATVSASGASRVSVVKTGTGSGTVTTPNTTPALDCGSICTGLRTAFLVLVATPIATSRITGWSDPQAGTSMFGAAPLSTTPFTMTVTFAAPSTTVRFLESQVDLGIVVNNTTTQTSLELQNIGTTPVNLGSPLLLPGSSGWTLGASTCGATLPAMSNCTIGAQVANPGLGDISAVVRILATEAGGTYYAEVPIVGRGGRRVTVIKQGSGNGTVTSSLPGITCGAMCTALFDQDVILTASPAAGSALTSWINCPQPSGLTCTVPNGVNTATVRPDFGLSP